MKRNILNGFMLITALMVLFPLGIHAERVDTIPLSGNGYIAVPDVDFKQMRQGGGHRSSPAFIDERRGGISNWRSEETIASVYFRVEEAGRFNLQLIGYGHSVITVTACGSAKKVKLNSDTPCAVKVGKFVVKAPGYVRVDLQGVKAESDRGFGNVTDLIVTADLGEVTYIRPGFSTHFGRRGPSTHLGYMLPRDKDIEWFYNEVTVPEEYDIPGSYYMACGFGEGYFGFQNNTPQPRRVLFSVWSPYVTDNANDIPDSLRVLALQRGEEVKINDFGGEGSGGQSFLQYNWKPGTTYKFLARVRPDGKGNTEYTGYFYSPDEGKWRLIAKFSRPKTNTWYKGAHSFLENFNPTMGYKTRKAYYNNQWARTADGEWIAINKAIFTHDETGRNGKRLDYTGGSDEQGFFLQMGGFFNDYTKGHTTFNKKNTSTPPDIDFDALD